jgi:hypothetical protein
MSDDKVTEHPNVRLRQEVESLRQEVKTLTALHQQAAQALLVVHEELKIIKKKISDPRS